MNHFQKHQSAAVQENRMNEYAMNKVIITETENQSLRIELEKSKAEVLRLTNLLESHGISAETKG